MPAGFQCLAGCIISWLATKTRNALPEFQVAAIDLNRHHAPKAVKGNRPTSQDGSSEPPLPINFGARSKQKRPADFQRGD